MILSLETAAVLSSYSVFLCLIFSSEGARAAHYTEHVSAFICL